jgi:hypothetical protein
MSEAQKAWEARERIVGGLQDRTYQADEIVSVRFDDLLTVVCALSKPRQPEPFAELKRLHRMCWCPGTCKPPPEGKGYCPAAKKYRGAELIALIERAAEALNARSGRAAVSDASRALLEAHEALSEIAAP